MMRPVMSSRPEGSEADRRAGTRASFADESFLIGRPGPGSAVPSGVTPNGARP